MQRQNIAILDTGGNAVRNASVRVVLAGTDTNASLFSANGSTPLVNPLTTDGSGECYYYAANGRYDEIVSRGGVVLETRFDVQLSDPADGDESAPLDRGYWKDITPAASIHRLRDRVFIGDGVVSSGKKIQGDDETWLTTAMGAYWFERGAQILSINTYGQFGGVFASRTSGQDLHDYGTAAIGVVGLANNDRTSGKGLAWGGYFEANRQATVPTGQGTTYGIEVAVKNNNNDVTNGPYNKFPGGSTIGLWMAAGGDKDYNGAGANPVTAAIVIGKNAKTWNKGIVFDADGITGTDGVTGTGIAISMAKGHVHEWQTPGGLQGAAIRSDVTDTAKRGGIIFNNDSTWLTAGGSIVGTFEKGAGTASYLRMISGAAGGVAQLKVTSTDTNSDLMLSPQGSGVLRVNYAAVAAGVPGNFSATRYLALKDSTGATFYVPAAAAPW